MSEYKTTYSFYTAWNYGKEIEDLNKASEQGWQLVRGGCFHSRFVKKPDVQYRYQLDYQSVDDMARYIETFREQGWEYVNSTYNHWHYFRKIYDPSLPEEAYEIFTDRESLREMTHRWVKLGIGFCIILAILTVLYTILLVCEPTLPRLILLATVVLELLVFLRGVFIMRRSDDKHSRGSDSALFVCFIIVLLLGLVSSITLLSIRPNPTSTMLSESVSEPLIDNQFGDFKIYYTDNYFLDLEIRSPEPTTFQIINETGEIVYSMETTEFKEEDIRLRLPRGQYSFSMSVTSGYYLDLELD